MKYIYYQRNTVAPIIVMDAGTGEKVRAKEVWIDGPSKVVWDERRRGVGVAVFVETEAEVRWI